MPPAAAQSVRRSSRVPVRVPVRVTSMEPDPQFSEICETLVVNAHGCALRFPLKLDTGSALRLHTRTGRQTTAYVVFCQPMGSDGKGFRLGAQLDRPENFWGLEACPDDWRVLEMGAPAAQTARKRSTNSLVLRPPISHQTPETQLIPQPVQTVSRSTREFLDKIEEQLSEDRLQAILSKLVRPLQAEVDQLREKLSANAKRNRFEVSLGYIPPELEEKLWERLRQDLGTRVLQQTREQSTELLSSAKAVIDQKTAAALTEFRHRLAGELHAVEQQAQILSKDLSASTQHHVRAGIEKLQRQALESGANLEVQSEKLLGSLQGQLASSHEAHRRDIDQIQVDSTAKASQLHSQVKDLGGRIATMNESVRQLESELDAHLESVASEIVSQSRTQLEAAIAQAFKDLQARGSNEVETRVNEICGHLRTIQNRIESSFAGSLKTQEEEALRSAAEQFEDRAKQSAKKWRVALARDLNSVASALGQNLRQELNSEGDEG